MRMSRHSANLRTRRPPIPPNRKFILVMEGKNTEPGYFRAMRQHYRGSLITIESIEAVGVPMTIARAAAGRKRAVVKMARKQSFEAGDQVWAVFDEDTHPNVKEAIKLCQDAGVEIAYSNPCFELWLILHEEDFGRLDDHHAVQKHLRSICPEYDPNGTKQVNFSRLMPKIEDAELRATQQRNQRKNEDSPFARPMTTVHELTAAIREAAKRKR